MNAGASHQASKLQSIFGRWPTSPTTARTRNTTTTTATNTHKAWRSSERASVIDPSGTILFFALMTPRDAAQAGRDRLEEPLEHVDARLPAVARGGRAAVGDESLAQPAVVEHAPE